MPWFFGSSSPNRYLGTTTSGPGRKVWTSLFFISHAIGNKYRKKKK